MSTIRVLLLHAVTIYMETSVGTYGSVRYSVDVRYWECLLMESALYFHTCNRASRSVAIATQ